MGPLLLLSLREDRLLVRTMISRCLLLSVLLLHAAASPLSISAATFSRHQLFVSEIERDAETYDADVKRSDYDGYVLRAAFDQPAFIAASFCNGSIEGLSSHP